MAAAWFKYDCSGSITDPMNYNLVSGTPICPTPKVHLCAIFADIQFIGAVQRPVITAALQAEINLAFSTKMESANVRLKPQ
ncbi:hypothetical protein SAMN05421820_103228 [Pedobacter steynii]|uniref:Uncharacterized protein n=1 Tax=Pedobacter steynii TaxID=430522 RepID=A0A1G9RGF6_9SPHI|nr:hypothetical protein SAMN05421820_103228 [Pedobacter steynii]